MALPMYWFGLSPNWIVGLLLMAPTIIDGLTQAMFNRESTNWLRLSTGLLAGMGLTTYSAIIGFGIGRLILRLIN